MWRKENLVSDQQESGVAVGAGSRPAARLRPGGSGPFVRTRALAVRDAGQPSTIRQGGPSPSRRPRPFAAFVRSCPGQGAGRYRVPWA